LSTSVVVVGLFAPQDGVSC